MLEVREEERDRWHVARDLPILGEKQGSFALKNGIRNGNALTEWNPMLLQVIA